MEMVPEFQLSEDERAFRTEMKRFVDEEIRPLDLNAYEWKADPRDRIPWDVIETAAAEYDVMYATVPEEYGGRDIDPLKLVLGVEELTVGDMGIGHLITYQWKWSKAVDLLASGDLRDDFYETFTNDPRHLVCAAATEPTVGSDKVTYPEYQFETAAERDGDEWVINGKKRYITNGADAQVYLLFAQTDPDAPATTGSTIFMVPREFDGVEVTHVHEKISQRLVNNGTIEFENVRVPEHRVLGEVNGAIEATDSINLSPIEAAATTLGTARRAFEDALAFSHERVQGGTEIINHQVVSNDFAGMYTDLHAARQLIWMAARALNEDAYESEHGAMANWFASRVAFDVAVRAHEKWGGAGIMMDEPYSPAQKYVRDTLSYLHSSGTEDVLKDKIAKSILDHEQLAVSF